jgi:hypothetical protein
LAGSSGSSSQGLLLFGLSFAYRDARRLLRGAWRDRPGRCEQQVPGADPEGSEIQDLRETMLTDLENDLIRHVGVLVKDSHQLRRRIREDEELIQGLYKLLVAIRDDYGFSGLSFRLQDVTVGACRRLEHYLDSEKRRPAKAPEKTR